MKVRFGDGKTKYGPGIQIDLSAKDLALAIEAYLVARQVVICGSRTISVNGELLEDGSVYVDPSGFVIHKNRRLEGRGEQTE